MLDSLCLHTYNSMEEILEEMKKDKLLRGESIDQDDPTQAIFEAEYNFLLKDETSSSRLY